MGVYGILYSVVTGRHKDWPKTRKEHLKKSPYCLACGTVNELEVHHEKPFHTHPELELVEENLMTLCRTHHLTFGHLMLWASWNPNVRQMVSDYYNRLIQRPVAVRQTIWVETSNSIQTVERQNDQLASEWSKPVQVFGLCLQAITVLVAAVFQKRNLQPGVKPRSEL